MKDRLEILRDIYVDFIKVGEAGVHINNLFKLGIFEVMSAEDLVAVADLMHMAKISFDNIIGKVANTYKPKENTLAQD